LYELAGARTTRTSGILSVATGIQRSKMSQLLVAFVVTVGLSAFAAGSQGPAQPVDPATLGPQVGASVPTFSLPDQHGRVQTPKSLAGPKGLMLVFARATSW
jgi:cytochrome oxidase Cu insertion factor (SCO1/SenC/PrrC family)